MLYFESENENIEAASESSQQSLTTGATARERSHHGTCELQKKGIRASVEWAPREGNRDADSLANGEVSSFSPSHRLRVVLGQLRWLVLPKALAHGRQAEELLRNAKSSGALPMRNVPGRRRRPEDRSRNKDLV